MISIQRADFNEPALVRFLEQHLIDMAPTAPPESRHALDLDSLQKPGVRLWVALDDDGSDSRRRGEIVGTVALATVETGHEELKSMRTDPHLRGRGIATKLLEYALDDASARGVARVSLETGSMQFFAAARALYAKAGFEVCAPFGAYVLDSNCVFMTKNL